MTTDSHQKTESAAEQPPPLVRPPMPPMGWWMERDDSYENNVLMTRRAIAATLGFSTTLLPPEEAPAMPPQMEMGGRTLSLLQGSAVPTITPSPELQAAFDAMGVRLSTLEDFIRWIPTPERDGIGGNFPPEALDEEPLSRAEWAELRQLIGELKAQPVVPQQQTPAEAIEAPSRLRYFAGKIASFLGRFLQDYSSGLAKKMGEATATVVTAWFLCLLGQKVLQSLADELIRTSDAVEKWLRLLGH
jgi:hypothetical protein